LTSCLAQAQGLGSPGAGWVGLRADGSLWRGDPADFDHDLGFDVAALADVDGHSLTSCAVDTSGALWCWGKNDQGQVGDGTTTSRLNPVLATAVGDSVQQATLSSTSGCVLKTGPNVWCWGGNGSGQLGNGTTDDSLVPVEPVGLPSDVTQVAMGAEHACALTSSGSVWCWGGNEYGELGAGTFESPQLQPAEVMPNARYISAGAFFTCAIDHDDALHCWGKNSDGNLGLGHTLHESAPVHVASLGSDVLHVDTAVRNACAVTNDGSVWCFGWQQHGRLGDGVDADGHVATPQRVAGPLGNGGAKAVYVTSGAACAHTTDDGLWCWGAGPFLDGQGSATEPVAIDFCSLPLVSSVTPDLGSTVGGNEVTIEGSDLDLSAEVAFGMVAAQSVTFVDDTTLRAVVPPHAAGAVDVVVVNPGGRRTVFPDGYTFVAPPYATAVTPNSGPASGGTPCTAHGTAFQPGASATLGGVPVVDLDVEGPSTIGFVTAEAPPGIADLVITNPDGQASTLEDAFTFVPPPTPMQLTPSQGYKGGGTVVDVTGTGFDWTTQVMFGGQSAPVVVFVDEQSLQVYTPAHAPGVVDVVASNDDGQSGHFTGGFTYVETPDPGTGGTGGTGSTDRKSVV